MTNIGHHTNSADARHRQIRLMQVLFAGAATIATLALFSAGPSDTTNVFASGWAPATATGPQLPQAAPIASGAAGNVIAVDDDTNPSSGDIFTQNAQDQSTANGAGT
jgi:hypothetical protein